MNVSAYRQPRWIAAAVIAAAVAAIVVVIAIAISSREAPDAARGTQGGDPLGVSPFELLAASVDEDFPQPPSSWSFAFPADHATHDEYRTEWWYVSGTLSAASGTDLPELGVQWLLMRVALHAEREPSTAAEAEPLENASAWRTAQIYAGLFSISALEGRGLRTDGKLSRGAVALAGASAAPVRIWIENWRLAALEGNVA